MIFKRKDSFFLDLSKAGKKATESKAAESKPAASKPAEEKTAPSQPAAPVQAAPVAPAPAAAAPAAAEPVAAAPAVAAPAGKPVLTTAEAVAAELRAAQEARPAPTNVTFAPDCLNPANAVPTPRRRAGANLGVFKGMVNEMFRS
jgi:hypothetical protein